jgi:broad specificity phosphatase PhoE
MGDLVLVRHGETDLNVNTAASSERIRGWNDHALNENGRHEAERLGQQFSGRPVAAIYASPLQRAFNTALEIQKTTGAELHKDFALMPWHLGYMTNQVVKSVIPTMNWHVENENEPVRMGEPFATYRKRFLGFLQRKIDEACSLPDKDFILLVTHSRGIQITKAWLKAGAPKDLSVDVPRMLDYKAETKTGGELGLRCTPDGAV